MSHYRVILKAMFHMTLLAAARGIPGSYFVNRFIDGLLICYVYLIVVVLAHWLATNLKPGRAK